MISTIVQQVCDALNGVVGAVPFVGSLFTQICSTIVTTLQSLGL
jgi:hypothetical protein